MNGQESRDKVRGFLDELEELVLEAGMKARVVDAVRERKSAVTQPMAEETWAQEIRQIDETFRYVEKQLCGNGGDVEGKEDGKEKIVRKQIEEIWVSCGDVVEGLQVSHKLSFLDGQEKLKRDMTDWTNVAANYEMMTEPARFRKKCSEAGQIYRQQADKAVAEYVEEGVREYGRAMDKTRGLVSAQEPGAFPVTARDIYEKWDSRKDTYSRDIRQRAEGLDKGEGALSEFGQSCTKPMEGIVRRERRKKWLQRFLPVIAVLLCILTGTLVSQMKEKNAAVLISVAGEEQPGEESPAGKAVSQFGEKVAEGSANLVIKNLTAFLGKVLLPVVVIFAVALVFWFLVTEKWYRRRLTEAMGSYMAEQISAFWKEDPFGGQADACLQRTKEFMEESFHAVYRSLFGEGGKAAGEEVPADRVKSLGRRWDQIRNIG